MKTATNAVARGIQSVHAQAPAASEVNATLENLNKAFADYKTANDERIQALESGKADVLDDDKVSRIDAAVSAMQKDMDKLNKMQAAADINGGTQSDPEYTAAFNAHMRQGDVQASLKKDPDADGGYLAPSEWDRSISKRMVELSAIRSLCAVQTISGSGFKKLFQNGGAASGWVDETEARNETGTPTFASLSYTTGELYANPAITQQMLDDSEINLETWLADEVQEQFVEQENLAFISGNGAKGKPTGLLTFATGGTNAAVHPFGAIGTVASGASGAITADAVIDLIYALKKGYRANAGFFCNNLTLRDIRKLKDGQGNYLWQPSYQAGEPSTIAGYRANEIEEMPDIAANSLSLGFGDLKRTYLIVDRRGVSILRDPFTNKPFVHFYTTKRVGGSLLNPEATKLLKTDA